MEIKEDEKLERDFISIKNKLDNRTKRQESHIKILEYKKMHDQRKSKKLRPRRLVEIIIPAAIIISISLIFINENLNSLIFPDKSGSNNSVTYSNMEIFTDDHKNIYTIIVDGWEERDFGFGENSVQFYLEQENIIIDIHQGLNIVSTANGETINMLQKNLENSNDYEEYVNSSLDYYSSINNGVSLEEIDIYNSIPIYQEEVDHRLRLLAFIEVDGQPFLVGLLWNGEGKTLELLKEKDYYLVYLETVAHTKPLKK